MGTKNNPGNYDCYAKAGDDEPMFVLLARDCDAPELVRQWAQIKEDAHGNPDKIAEARKCADEMEAYWFEINRSDDDKPIPRYDEGDPTAND